MATHRKQVNSLLQFKPSRLTRSPVVQPTHRQNSQQHVDPHPEQLKIPVHKGLQRCESMQETPTLNDTPLHENLKKMQIIQTDIANTELKMISIEKLQNWSKTLIQYCKVLEQLAQKSIPQQHQPQQINLPQHHYAFKIISQSDILERQIAEEILNRKKLEEQTNQMIKYQEQEINQLLMKIKSLEQQLN